MEVEQSGEVLEKSTQLVADTERVRNEVKPFAKTILNKITLYANNKYADGNRMVLAIACAVLERATVSTAGRFYKDDRAAGERWIERIYDASKEDAVAQWREM